MTQEILFSGLHFRNSGSFENDRPKSIKHFSTARFISYIVLEDVGELKQG